MKALINLTKENQNALEEICEKENISRAEAIRRAITLFSEAFKKSQSKKKRSVFGMWKDREESTEEYLSQIRKEWDQE